jgi:hypothetical protein
LFTDIVPGITMLLLLFAHAKYVFGVELVVASANPPDTTAAVMMALTTAAPKTARRR